MSRAGSSTQPANVVYQVDGEGYVTQSQYDGLGRITETTAYANVVSLPEDESSSIDVAAALQKDAAADRTNRFSYDAAGRLVASSDPMGFVETYAYDALGNKTSFTNKNGATWTYNYDAAGRLTTETTPEIPLTSVSQGADGLIVDAAHSGRSSVVTRLSYDALGNLLSRTEASGRPEARTSSYVYDALGRQVKAIYPPVSVYVPASDNLAANGQNGSAVRVEQTVTPVTQTFYDAFGDAVANIDVAGNVSYKAYDVLGRVAYDIDANGYVTGYGRDNLGNVVTLTRFAEQTTLAQGAVRPLTQADVDSVVYGDSIDHTRDRVIQKSYDRLGRAIYVEEPKTFVYETSGYGGYGYGNGYMYAAEVTYYTYNAFGDVTEVDKAIPNGGSGTDSLSYYDRRGNKIGVVDALGYLNTMEYDAAGNQVTETQYATQPSYGSWGFEKPEATPKDRVTVYAYDLNNHKVSETRKSVRYSDASNGSVTSGDLTTYYGYDAVGNQTFVTDAAGARTYTYHDALGRVTAIAAPADYSNAAHTRLIPLTEFKRDVYGNVVAQVSYANGASHADLNGYAVSGTSLSDRATLTRYDAVGNALATTNAVGDTLYSSYDVSGHVVKHWQTVTDVDGGKRTWFEAFTYDKLGHQTSQITPASTVRLQEGVTTSYSSSNQVTDYTGSLFQNGTNSVSVAWSTLTDSQGGDVKVQVNYNTVSTYTQVTDESSSIVYSGAPSAPASSTQIFSASQAAGGVTLAWADNYASTGGIHDVAQITIWQQDPATGTWVLKWSGGPSNADGSSMTTVSQEAAGIDTTHMSYNGFGELTNKAVNAQPGIYYDYDNAGHVWRTNANGGVDTVMLYNHLGQTTSIIQSGGVGGSNDDLRSYWSAEDAAYNSGLRRTDLYHDALGNTVKTVQVARGSYQGGVTHVRNQVGGAIVSSAIASGDESSAVTWTGTNKVSLSWTSIADLGSGEVKVVMDYLTFGAPIYDESGNVTGTTPGVLKSYSQVLAGSQARTGTTMTWDGGGIGDTGGVAGVAHVRVYKKDIHGDWQLIVDQSPQDQGKTYFDIAAPSDPTTAVTLQVQLLSPDRTEDGPWTTVALTNFGDAYRFDMSSLPQGQYAYRVVLSPHGVPLPQDGTWLIPDGATELSDGYLTEGHLTEGHLTLSSRSDSVIPFGTSSLTPTGTTLSWNSVGERTQFAYRAVGSTEWITLPVSLQSSAGSMEGVDLSALPPGQYEYEVLFGTPWQSHRTGTVSISPATPVYVPPAANLYATNVSAGVGGKVDFSWFDFGATPALFRYRLQGSSTWQTATVTPTTVTEGYGGQTTTYHVSLPAAGDYDYEVIYVDPATQAATGHATGAIHWQFGWGYNWVNQENPEGYWVSTSLSSTDTTASHSDPISLPPGSTFIEQYSAEGPQANDVTVSQTFDRWGNVLSVSDARNGNWVTTYAYDASNHLISTSAPSTDGTGVRA